MSDQHADTVAMRKRWKVQAGIRKEWAGGKGEPVPYQATYYRTRWAARRQVRALEGSFAPGMAWVRMTRIDGSTANEEGGSVGT